MAKVTLNPSIETAQGQLGNLAFRRAHTGAITLIKRADMSKVKWSKEQKAHRQRFKEAIVYAKAAMSEPKVRAKYEKTANKLGKRPFDLAVSDYFKGRNLLPAKSK